MQSILTTKLQYASGLPVTPVRLHLFSHCGTWQITKIVSSPKTMKYSSIFHMRFALFVTITGLSSGECLQRQMQLCFFLQFPPISCEIVYFLHGLPGNSGSCVIKFFNIFCLLSEIISSLPSKSNCPRQTLQGILSCCKTLLASKRFWLFLCGLHL